jgi:uncharacterized protein YceK
LPWTFQGYYPTGDGEVPEGDLVQDSSGALYGETIHGGVSTCYLAEYHGCGVVFKLTPSGSGYVESVIYQFQSITDGFQPAGGLVLDSSGALYGVTNFGGTGSCSLGCGTVFKLTPTPSGYSKTTIHEFSGSPDASIPTGKLIMDSSGSLYGTTEAGGNSTSCGSCGTVFKLTPSGGGYNETILYRFQGGSDGAGVSRGVVADSLGDLYGATTAGGGSAYNCAVGGSSCGTVYKLTPSTSGGVTSYTESVLYAFQGGSDGGAPYSVIVDATSLVPPVALFGTASLGGSGGYGVVFKITQ